MPPSNDPLGKRALFWAPGERIDSSPLAPKAPVPDRRALFSAAAPLAGPVALECSSCRVTSHVSYLDFVRLHLPVWLWLPGRRFSRLMGCPACERRTWVHVTWRP
jgi:hypothetical protein